MAKGNWNKNTHPQQRHVPKQKGKGENTPQGSRSARAYNGKATGKPDKPAKSSEM